MSTWDQALSTANPTAGHHRSRQAASLMHTLAWRLEQLVKPLERYGHHRAAPELAHAAQRIARQQPALATAMAEQARRWQAE